MGAGLDELILEGARHALVAGGDAQPPEAAPRLIMNDYRKGEKMLASIEAELRRCTAFAFSVAFVSRSGVCPLKQTLREAEARGVRGRILTTDYLSFSEPAALEELARFSNIDVRMYRTEGISDRAGFHTKGYLFEYADGSRRLFVGSSNMTGGALSDNKEWNVELTALPEGSLARAASMEFEELWELAEPLDAVLDVYREAYANKKAQMQAAKVMQIERLRLVPNTMQSAFVASLEEIIEAGERRALLISATGTGKTYAAAFAIQHFNPKRLLFLVHREQVLRKARESFRTVLGSKKSFGLLSGTAHDFEADYLFATMQTMSREDVLARFAPDDFDFIVIDEVHRAGSASYKRILAHFKPRFCLGMTASPDRPDGFDIYALFDNNIAYEIRLQQALEENLLCPFHYFGVSDIQVEGQPIAEDADFNDLVCDERVLHIAEQAEFFGHSGARVQGLIFCSRKDEARALSGKLNDLGYSTLALSGDDSQGKRENAVARLAATPESAFWDDRLDYILTVDIFNEGVDIPEVNQVIMLRPTQSPIVFVQQLGRGLRKSDDKEYVVVIDFIGNYTNNYLIPIALSGDRSYNKDSIRRYVMEGDRVIPGSSTVHFDEIARERIFASIDDSTVNMRLLVEQYKLVKHKLGRVPRMVDFLRHGGIDPMLFVEKCKSYARFLAGHEKDVDLGLTESEHLVIEFVSCYCANGQRPHELLALQMLLDGRAVTRDGMEKRLVYYAVPLTDAAYRSMGHVLDKTFVNAPADKKAYDDFEIVQFEPDGTIVGTESFDEMLAHASFRAVLSDVVQFGLMRCGEKFAGAEGGLKLGEKYSRKDVCRLLNWDKDNSSTVYGYQINKESNTCPIFVTYNKDDDISATTQYADRFESRTVFSWMTRSRRKLTSPEVVSISQADETGLSVHLFVKKSDGEGSDFYYLGRVHPGAAVQTVQPTDDGDTVPIVNFRLHLEHPVGEELYDYLTGSGGEGSALGIPA